MKSILNIISFIIDCALGIVEFIAGLLIGLGITYIAAQIALATPIIGVFLYYLVWIIGIIASVIGALFPE